MAECQSMPNLSLSQKERSARLPGRLENDFFGEADEAALRRDTKYFVILIPRRCELEPRISHRVSRIVIFAPVNQSPIDLGNLKTP